MTVNQLKAAIMSHKIAPKGKKADLENQLFAIENHYETAIASMPASPPIPQEIIKPAVIVAPASQKQPLAALLLQIVWLCLVWVVQYATERSETARALYATIAWAMATVHHAGFICGRWVYSLENVQLIPSLK